MSLWLRKIYNLIRILYWLSLLLIYIEIREGKFKHQMNKCVDFYSFVIGNLLLELLTSFVNFRV